MGNRIASAPCCCGGEGGGCCENWTNAATLPTSLWVTFHDCAGLYAGLNGISVEVPLLYSSLSAWPYTMTWAEWAHSQPVAIDAGRFQRITISMNCHLGANESFGAYITLYYLDETGHWATCTETTGSCRRIHCNPLLARGCAGYFVPLGICGYVEGSPNGNRVCYSVTE